jgi:hypothetical protein
LIVSSLAIEGDAWVAFVAKCKAIAGNIRSNLASALLGYHTLGKALADANLHGKQIKALSRELGQGFSLSNLYNCIRFAQQYPDFQAFTTKYGVRAWREVPRLLVDRSQTVSNALETQATAGQPVTVEVTYPIPIEKHVKLHPRTIAYYIEAKKLRYGGNLGAFLSECVDGFFKNLGYRFGVRRSDGRIEYWDEFAPP